MILVNFPNHRVFPFFIRAQIALKDKDLIRPTDIAHKMFLHRAEKYREYTNWSSDPEIIFTDSIYGNQYNLRDEQEFFDALVMQECDPEFEVKRIMKVYVVET